MKKFSLRNISDIQIQGPYLNKTRTHLQRVLGDENVLRVKFAEDETDKSLRNCSTDSNVFYNKIAREGIFVGLRQYHFFGEFIFFGQTGSVVV